MANSLADQILQMLLLQEEMNKKVHPEWRTQEFEFYRAIWTECAELMDHHGWKWWKKQTADIEQIKLEVVDIWHFGMSIHLQKREDHANLAQELAVQFKPQTESDDFLLAVELLAQCTLTTKQFNVGHFFQLMNLMDMSPDELFKQYVGKNVLNFFRQDHGYKDGTYQKIWNGREDNEHLSEVLTQLDTHSHNFRDLVYSALEGRYPS